MCMCVCVCETERERERERESARAFLLRLRVPFVFLHDMFRTEFSVLLKTYFLNCSIYIQSIMPVSQSIMPVSIVDSISYTPLRAVLFFAAALVVIKSALLPPEPHLRAKVSVTIIAAFTSVLCNSGVLTRKLLCLARWDRDGGYFEDGFVTVRFEP